MTKNTIKYNWASLFANKNGGKPMPSNGEPIKDKNGLYVLIPHFTCYLNINEPLPAGEYIIKFKEKLSQSGKLYYGGAVKIKDQENYKPSQHQEAKQNGYQPDMKGLVKPVIEDQEIIDDEIPF